MAPSTPTKRKTSRSSPETPSKSAKPTPPVTPAGGATATAETPSSPNTAPVIYDRFNPPIRSQFVKKQGAAGKAVHDSLPAEQQAFYEKLKAYHNGIAAKAAATTVKAEIKRHATLQMRIIAAMAWLQGPWDTNKFDFWGRNDDMDFQAQRFTDCYGGLAQKTIKAWTQKRGVSEDSTRTRRSTETTKAQEIVKAWYGGRCILTGAWEVEACHIVANSIEKNDVSPFWEGLSAFWPRNKVNELRAMIKKPEYQNTNLLVLRNDCHTLWEQCKFALKALPSTMEGELQIEFVWLDVKTPGLVGNSRSADMSVLHWAKHGEKSEVYETGDRITLTTIDTSAFPLPSVFLLDLQYHFNKIVRAAAAAEPLELLFHHDTLPDLEVPNSDAETSEDGFDDDFYQDVPEFRELLIQSAISHGILSKPGADFWRGLLRPREEFTSQSFALSAQPV